MLYAGCGGFFLGAKQYGMCHVHYGGFDILLAGCRMLEFRQETVSATVACSKHTLWYGAISFQLSVFRLSYREGYFQQFMCSVLVNLLAGVIAVIVAMLFF